MMEQYLLVILWLFSLPCLGIKSPSEHGRSDQIMTASIGENVLLFSVTFTACLMCNALTAPGTIHCKVSCNRLFVNSVNFLFIRIWVAL